MNSIQQYLATLVASLIIFSLNSCTAPSPDRRESIPPIPTPTVASVKNPAIARLPQPVSRQLPITLKTVKANIYQVDNQCQALLPQSVTLPAQKSLEAAVAKVLEQQSTSDLNLNYRVSLEPESGLVTIDLRVPANSARRLSSLSSCEQLALFGSLRQTLTSNRLWRVKNVRFTELGEDIWL